MQERSPYVTNFGKIPTKYIQRDLIIDEIIYALEEPVPQEQAFKLTGIRGSGKTSTLTDIENYFRSQNEWIVISVNSESNIMEDLISKLYSKCIFIKNYIDANFDLNFLGVNVHIEKKNNIDSLSAVLEQLLKELQNNKKRLLITMDEIHKTPYVIEFIKNLQDYIRYNYPVFFIADGLYEDIESVENTDGLTFFFRAESYEMLPLNLTLIRKDYEKTLNLSFEVADDMAALTKGYAFCYQALGKYMWLSKSKEISEDVLIKLDDALSEKVYKKLWSELTEKDKFYLSYIVKKDTMDVSELLELTKSKHSDFSISRNRLAEKRIIDITQRGKVSIQLPRFKIFVENQYF